MAIKRYRKSNKSKELTYEDIKGLDFSTMSSEDLEKYGFGSWLKKNAGVIGTVVGAGAGMLLGPAGSIAGASLGASIGGTVGGAVSHGEIAKEAIQTQNAQTAAIEQQQMVNNKTQELNNIDNPLYSGVMRRGGRIRKMEYGGEITTANGNSGPKTSSNLITLSKGDKALQKKLRNYQGILTNTYADTFKSYVDVEKELRNKYNDPYKFDRRKLDTYAQDFINTYGDLALTSEQMRSALGEEAYVDYVNSMNQYLGTKYSTSVGTNMAGVKEDNSNQLRFGPRQIIERYNWNSKDNTSPYTFIEDRDKSTPKKKYGGTLNYGGQLHEGPNGGVPVDAMGNPNSMNPVALVEKGEVSYNTPDGGTYIYSDTLKHDKGKTFAKKAKDVQRRYKFRMKDGVINDPFAKKFYDNEMLELMNNQEELRDFQDIQNNINEKELPEAKNGIYIKPENRGKFNATKERTGKTIEELTHSKNPLTRKRAIFAQNASKWNKEYGGDLPMYWDGSTLPPLVKPETSTAYEDLNTMLDADINSFKRTLELWNKYPKVANWKAPKVNPGSIQQMQKALGITTNNSNPQLPPLVKPISDTAAMDEFDNQVEMDYLKMQQDVGNLAKKSNPQLYQGMNWAETGLAAAAPVLGGITGLILNNRRKAPVNLKLSRMTPQQISLERRRAAARESAGVATSNLTRSLRNAAPTAGSYMSNVVAGITDIDRNLSNALGESYTQEEIQNAQLRQQADAANLDIDMQEQMYNSQLQNQFDASKKAASNAYLSQIGQGVTSALNQKFQSSRDADYLNMRNPDYAMVVTGKGLRRRKMIVPRTQIGG